MAFRAAHACFGAAGRGDDRLVIVAQPDRIVIAVADGAGGSGRGAHAAERLIRLIELRGDSESLDVMALLTHCDSELRREAAGGETTAVVAVVDESGVSGASVGDSGAWIVGAEGAVDLTHLQVHKPLIGSGQAVPVPFRHGALNETLLLATDGLLKYGRMEQIREVALVEDLEAAPGRLIDLVRLRSGALQDDTTVVICRRT
jgi:serine/threonine protein phosphatase PrpC